MQLAYHNLILSAIKHLFQNITIASQQIMPPEAKIFNPFVHTSVRHVPLLVRSARWMRKYSRDTSGELPIYCFWGPRSDLTYPASSLNNSQSEIKYSANISTIMTARDSVSVRQPISCEPCRKRKIRCSRNRPPCDTCKRRNVQDRCFYMADRDESHTVQSNTSNEELLNRISNLETLLAKQSSSQAFEMGSGNYNSNMISPPSESGQIDRLSPASVISDISSPSTAAVQEHPVSYGIGALRTTGDGNVRYEPNSSQWTSILANTSLSISTPSIIDIDVGSLTTNSFPFSHGPVVPFDDLLPILPPTQQCDYLKHKYFSVFSPVSVAITLSNFASNSDSC